jgi:hypothetical protein
MIRKVAQSSITAADVNVIYFRSWHKADVDRGDPECPFSGAKLTFRRRLADIRF